MTPNSTHTRTDSDVYRLLAARPRRLVLQALIDTEVAQLEELAEYVVSHAPEQGPNDHDRILTALYHWHLPKLADAGLIEYDTRSKTVRYYGDHSVEPLLDIHEDLGG